MVVKELVTNSGRKAYEAVCDLVLELGEWIDSGFVPFAGAHLESLGWPVTPNVWRTRARGTSGLAEGSTWDRGLPPADPLHRRWA